METTNARCDVAYFTMSVPGTPDDSDREAIEVLARSNGGCVTWQINPVAGRSYALLELPGDFDQAQLSRLPGATVYDAAIIALAVFPTVPEALPHLCEALGGDGRPAGVRACRVAGDAAIVEWDPGRCGVAIVTKLVDVELRRFQSGRRTELLSPLPPSVVAKIASEGLQAPEIATDRILELLIER